MKKIMMIFAGLLCCVCMESKGSEWRIGAEISPAYPLPTNSFLKGDNIYGERVDATFTGTLRGDFSFNPQSKWGMLYPGLYQGLGVDVRTFFRQRLLGTPVSVYILQGAPFKHFSKRLWMGYEWRFGAAFGWSDRSGDFYDYAFYPAISTRVTAHMGVSLKLTYALSERWQISCGVDATHFSNGNTSFPNSGINTLGVSAGVSYVINPQPDTYKPSEELIEEEDRKKWLWDILAYGAWRKRQVHIEDTAPVLPGTFGVAGMQFSSLRKFNRYFCAGAALDMKYDSSAGKEPYWVGGYYDEMKFAKVPFFKRCSVGLGGVAEFTMPIFTVGAGIGVDLISPVGDKRFYQLLYIKAFMTKHLYLNAGYRLGDFKEPQNLMLGLGVRF
ncbi:MAG: acyloxyacyl hydrolase [Muribaculaceae bacterium]|nr:acyloxyacyl hydrolase [Muribaculaceae bacterium]